jgi:hypothetical protein
MARKDRKSQRARRRHMKFRDIHGRRWGAEVEKETGEPTGAIQPDFKAPIYPPPAYLGTDADNIGLLVINYELWLTQTEERIAKRQEQLEGYAVAMYPDPTEAIKNPPPELRRVVGPEPEVHPDLIRACMDENDWVLGRDPVMPEWAKPLMQTVRAPKARHFPSAAEEAAARGRADTALEKAEAAFARTRPVITREGAAALAALPDDLEDGSGDETGEGVVVGEEDTDRRAEELDEEQEEIERQARESREATSRRTRSRSPANA